MAKTDLTTYPKAGASRRTAAQVGAKGYKKGGPVCMSKGGKVKKSK